MLSKLEKEYSNPRVSIICNTYNHQDYIEDAIKCFLMQETDFSFEIMSNLTSMFYTAKFVRSIKMH